MADLVITAANVLTSANAKIVTGIAGETVTAGQVVYQNSPFTTYNKAKANVAIPGSVVAGIVLNNASTGQPISICVSDPQFTPGATLTNADVFILSGASFGGIAPVSDKASGWFTTVLGVGIGGNKMNFSPVVAGIAAP